MSVTSRLETLSREPERLDTPQLERVLWVATLALYGVGDVLSSVISMENGGVEATRFLASWVAEYGYIALVAHKLGILLVVLALVGYRDRVRGLVGLLSDAIGVPSSPFRSALLAMFALRGAALVAWNSYVIYVLLTGGYAVSPF